MEIKQASFVISNTQVAKCPAHKLPEYAFIGRSNVGKSSLINMLTNHKGLAKTSSKPGKTQLINHFLINKQWYLVDLPGYGYAQVSKQSKKTFQQFITDYFKKRKELVSAFVLVDIRHEPQKIDLGFRLGRNYLIDMFQELEKIGVNHTMLVLKYSTRPAAEVLEEIGKEVLPEFK